MTNSKQNLRLIAVAICHGILAIAFCFIWFGIVAKTGNPEADFTAYYTGWKMLLSGDQAQLYDVATQTRYQQALFGDGLQFGDGLLPFVNPPYLSWQLAPLALLPLSSAYGLWALINLGCLMVSLRVLLKYTHHWSTPARLALAATVCGFYPVYATFLLGSFPLLMLLCLVLLFHNTINERYRRAGLWLVIASIKFQLIVFVGIWLLATRRWRVLGWAAAYGASLAAITTVLLGWEVWGDYLQLLSFHSQSFDRFGIYPAEAYTLKGTLTLLLGRSASNTINLIAQIGFVVTAGVLGWWFWRHPPHERSEAGWQYGLAMLLNLLLSLHLNLHDAVLLIIPAFFMTLWLQQHGTLTSSFVAFVLSFPIVFYFSHTLIGKRFGIQIPVIWMVALLLWMLYLEQRTHTRRDRAYE